MSYDEIADEMQLASPDAARALYSKALRALRNEMPNDNTTSS